MSPSRAIPWTSFVAVVAATATLHMVFASPPPAPSPPSPSCSLGPPPTLCKQCSNRSMELLQRHFGDTPSIPFEPECQYIFAGCKDDGVGAQAQAKLSAYAFAKAMGKVYVHVPFLTIGHFKDEQEADKVAQEMEEFFNLGLDEMSLEDAAKENATVCAVKHCHNFLDIGGQACWEPVQEELRRKYNSSPKPEPFHNSSRLTVAIHVRRGDVDPSSVVVHAYNGNWMRHTPDEYYIATLDVLTQALPKHMRNQLDVVLLSEGQPSDFEAILKAHPGVRLVLNGDIRRALHTLVTADVLVTARSSFSYTAALYNTGIVIYEPFWHVQHPGWLKNENPFAHQAEQANEKGSSMYSLLQQLQAASTKRLLEKRLRERSVRMR